MTATLLSLLVLTVPAATAGGDDCVDRDLEARLAGIQSRDSAGTEIVAVRKQPLHPRQRIAMPVSLERGYRYEVALMVSHKGGMPTLGIELLDAALEPVSAVSGPPPVVNAGYRWRSGEHTLTVGYDDGTSARSRCVYAVLTRAADAAPPPPVPSIIRDAIDVTDARGE